VSKALFRYYISLFVVFGMIAFSALAEDIQYRCPDEFDAPRLTWSGFIETETWFDTRQNVTKRHGNELLFPLPKKFDVNGCDINKHPDYGIIPFNVRLRARLDGPPVFCTQKTYAFFSGDFRGIDDEISPAFRFRKGFVQFDWGKIALLVGQEDHPMYLSDCKPNTVAYSRGAPIAQRARVPQFRFIWRPEICGCEVPEDPLDEIWFTLYSQSRTTRSRGPFGPSINYIQDGVMPAMDLQWRKYIDDYTFYGIGADFKRIVPRLSTQDMQFKDAKSIISGILYAYLCHSRPEFALRTKLMYIHDGSEFGFISGYAVDYENPITKRRSYTNLRSFSYWLDMDLCPAAQWSPGILLAVARNLGADKPLFRDDDGNLITYAGAAEIGFLGRVAPRLWYKCGPMTFGAEVEWTYAEYGTLNDFGSPSINPIGVGNVRFLGALFYYF
jgi:hypothetical protein